MSFLPTGEPLDVPERDPRLVLADLRVRAGQAAADLFAAANAHLVDHGDHPDAWTMAALDAVEALSDIATHGVDPDDSLPPPERTQR